MIDLKPSKQDPLKIRRRRSGVAFWVLVILAIGIPVLCVIGGEHVADNLQSATGVMVILVPALVSICLQYAHIADRHEIKPGKENV